MSNAKTPEERQTYENRLRSMGLLRLIHSLDADCFGQFMSNESTLKSLSEFRGKLLAGNDDTPVTSMPNTAPKKPRWGCIGMGNLVRRLLGLCKPKRDSIVVLDHVENTDPAYILVTDELGNIKPVFHDETSGKMIPREDFVRSERCRSIWDMVESIDHTIPDCADIQANSPKFIRGLRIEHRAGVGDHYKQLIEKSIGRHKSISMAIRSGGLKIDALHGMSVFDIFEQTASQAMYATTMTKSWEGQHLESRLKNFALAINSSYVAITVLDDIYGNLDWIFQLSNWEDVIDKITHKYPAQEEREAMCQLFSRVSEITPNQVLEKIGSLTGFELRMVRPVVLKQAIREGLIKPCQLNDLDDSMKEFYLAADLGL